MLPGLIVFSLVAQIPTAPVEVPFRTIAFGTNRLVRDGGAIVMRDARAFDAYRAKMGTGDQKKPAIDWTKEQVLAIHVAGTLYYSDSIQVVKVLRGPNGLLEVDAALDRGSMPATPTPGVVPVLHKEGLYSIIVVPTAPGEVTLKLVDPPARSGDRNGISGSR